MSAVRELTAALISAGMDPVDAAVLIARAGVELAHQSDARTPGARRQAAYRERNKASPSVTDVTEPEASQSVTNRNETSQSDAASLSIEKKDSNCSIERDGSSKSKASRAKPRTRLPGDWSLAEVDYEYAAKHGFDRQRAARMGETFRNHHLGRGTVMADWSAAWRTWVGNEVKYAGGRNGSGSSQNRADTAAGRASSREADMLAAVGRGALRVLENGYAARAGGAVPANPGPAERNDPERDAAWADYQSRVGHR